MAIVLTRVDDRLIHGQVVVGWTRTVNGSFILVIDDIVAKDKMQITLLKLATPTGVKSEILSVEDAVESLNKGKYDNENLIILVKSPATINELLERGVDLNAVNIGNIRANSERKQILKGVNATVEEITIWKSLSDKGIRLIAQGFPDQKKHDFNEILESL